MATSYQYSLTTDFTASHAIGSTQFIKTVQANSSLVGQLRGLKINGDIVSVIFDPALSPAQITDLNAIVAAHTPDITPPVQGNFWSQSGDGLFYNNGVDGNIAIGSTAINNSRVRIVGNGLGNADPWLEIVGDANDVDAGVIQYYLSGITDGPALKLRDFDNPPRIEFEQIGAGTLTGPQFATWLGMDGQLTTNMRLEGGNLGLGITPTQKLHVLGNIAVSGTVDGRDVSVDGTTLDSHVANTGIHVDHNSVSILAGIGLTGGGKITANRTLALDINGLILNTGPNFVTDFIPYYDVSAATIKKVPIDNINSPFGNNYNYVESATGTSQTSVAFLTALSLNTGTGANIISAGTYRISWFYIWSYSVVANEGFLGRVQVDGSTIFSQQQRPATTTATQRNITSGFHKMSLTSASHTINLDYAASAAGNLATITNMKLEIFRIS